MQAKATASAALQRTSSTSELILQMTAAMELEIADKEDLPQDEHNDSCSICLFKLIDGVATANILFDKPSCGHASELHALWALTWFAKTPSCPVCRAEVMSDS